MKAEKNELNEKSYDVKIFESPISDESFSRVKEELDKNPKFQINNDNITEFVDCKLVLDILKQHKIEYKIVANDRWSGTVQMPQYDLLVCIYISQKDYVLIKYLLEPEKEVEDDKNDVENDKITKNINLAYNIFINLICFAMGIPFLILGIQLIGKDTPTAIIFIVIGGGFLVSRISKISKIINKKLVKRL